VITPPPSTEKTFHAQDAQMESTRLDASKLAKDWRKRQLAEEAALGSSKRSLSESDTSLGSFMEPQRPAKKPRTMSQSAKGSR
jgi:hypothetical protein